MAITVTSKGTAQGKGVASIAVPATFQAGDAVIVTLAGEQGANAVLLQRADFTTVRQKTGGQYDVQAVHANVTAQIYSFLGLTAQEAADITQVRVTAIVSLVGAMTVYSSSGLDPSAAFDKSSSSTGTGTTPSSGQTPTLSQADELLIGCIGTEGPNGDAPGTWDAGANQTTDNNQRLGTTGGAAASNITCASATKIVSATTGGIASKTGITSRNWAAAIATYKAAAPPSGGDVLYYQIV